MSTEQIEELERLILNLDSSEILEIKSSLLRQLRKYNINLRLSTNLNEILLYYKQNYLKNSKEYIKFKESLIIQYYEKITSKNEFF